MKFILAILLILILIIIISFLLWYIISRSKESNEINSVYDIDDDNYREYIHQSVQKEFKPYLQQILNNIDLINSLIRKNNKEFDRATYEAMSEVYRKADETERLINKYWNSIKFKQNFHDCIGLHYTSHLLGKVLKQEQQDIKDVFVDCKNKQKAMGNYIDNLKYRQQRVIANQKFVIGKEISICCKKHKQMSIVASEIGAINSEYNKRVTQQNMETAKKRDYIAENFGERGRLWKERMHNRALKRKTI